ncbi:AAA family ATPase [Candidatus Woesearchaeota archaeon]|nr:AAA family ATPase [Candidatus Woesearchaeota archaeon]
MSTLFKDMLSSDESVFKNEDALDFDYIPKLMPFRETQQSYVAACIAPLLQGRNGKNLFISGAPGIGKTAAVRWVLRDLEEETDEVVPIYINCWQKNTTYKIMLEICDQLGYKFTHNKKTEELFAVIKDILNKKAAVFVFDEIDKIQDFDFLYTIMEEIYKKSIILITNFKEWMAELDQRIKSRLTPEPLQFRQYNPAETDKILRKRIDYAFVPGVWEDSALRLISKKTSDIKDIRSGLYLLRQSGLAAEDRSSRKIGEGHAKVALEKLDEFTIKGSDQLEDETKFILDLVKQKSGSRIGDLHRMYLQKGGHSSYKSFRRKITKLEESKFITLERVTDKTGNTSIVKYNNVKKLTDF